MMYYLNKVVYALINPIAVTLILIVASVVVVAFCDCKKGSKGRKWAIVLGALGFLYLYFFSLPITAIVLGYPLEREYPPALAASLPEADAIVLLGGGMSANTNSCPYAEMRAGADRVWHAARLYHAGKAPVIIPTGCGEYDSTRPLLIDFGVPEEAIIVENDARNTEENAMFVERILNERASGDGSRPKVLVVTSAWHMRRSLLMFRNYAKSLDIIPAPSDHEATTTILKDLEISDFMPSADALSGNDAAFKEIVGYIGYSLFRR